MAKTAARLLSFDRQIKAIKALQLEESVKQRAIAEIEAERAELVRSIEDAAKQLTLVAAPKSK